MDATMEYNLGEVKAQLERCERGFQELQATAQRYLNDLAMLRSQFHTMAVQMGVEPLPPDTPISTDKGEEKPGPPPEPVASPPTPPESTPSSASPATVTTAPTPATGTPRSSGGSSRSGSSRSSGEA